MVEDVELLLGAKRLDLLDDGGPRSCPSLFVERVDILLPERLDRPEVEEDVVGRKRRGNDGRVLVGHLLAKTLQCRLQSESASGLSVLECRHETFLSTNLQVYFDAREEVDRDYGTRLQTQQESSEGTHCDRLSPSAR